LPTIACRSLENDLLIKDDKKSYTGGNQGWFLSLGYKDIAEYGCGIIAICNFLMCLNIFKKKGARVTEHQNKDKTKKNNKNSFDNL